MDDFIDDFIQEYKRQPSLWQTSHPDFKNRKKRQEAYLKLIEVANKHNEAYNIERTKQKINNLRCAFRVQLKKYNEVKSNSKDGKEETYCPKRKYFESLMFLLNEETSVDTGNDTSKTKTAKRNYEVASKTRNKALSRKKIDKELDAITLDLKDDLEADENFLVQSIETEKENKSKSDFEENEEAFNLALIEEEENLSVCNTKEIDPDAFESIIEEDDQSNKEIQPDLIKISQVASTVQQNEIQKQKVPHLTKQNNKAQQLSDENIVILQPVSTTPVSMATSTSTTTTMATRGNFRQVQTKPTLQSNTKFTSISHINNKSTRIVQLRSIKALPNNNLQAVPSTTKHPHQQTQNINSQKRSTSLTTQSPISSSITMPSISSLTTSKVNVTSPIIAQKVVLPKISTQQVTIRNPQNQLQTRSTTIPTSGITLSSPQKNVCDGEFNNTGANMESQSKKIKLDFDSSNLEKILNLAYSKLKQEDSEDDFTLFGRMVTCKLKTMNGEQAIIAQRLITEILFDGQMKLLQLPQQNSQKTVTSDLPHIFTQSLQATPITSLRHINANGQTFFISEMNENNANIETGTIQFSANNSGNVEISSSEC